jgi:hypothetical protein
MKFTLRQAASRFDVRNTHRILVTTSRPNAQAQRRSFTASAGALCWAVAYGCIRQTLLTLCFNLPKRLPFSGRANANPANVITNLWVRVIDDVSRLSCADGWRVASADLNWVICRPK